MKLKISGSAFDLDATLYDFDRLLGPHDYNIARKKMKDVGMGDWFLNIMDELYKTTSFVEILNTLKEEPYSVDERILKAGYDSYNNLEFGKISPSPDVIPTLEKLKDYGIKRALVTTGVADRQQRKVDMLGVRMLFDKICIVRDFCLEESKGKCFEEFANEYSIPYDEMMVIGDKCSKEIREGNELGMITVQIIQGRHAKRSPRDPREIPDYKIKSISEILNFIK